MGFKRIALSIGSALGTAAVTYAIYPSIIAFTMCAVLLSHEIAHYVAGVTLGFDVNLPVFIPLVVGILAWTKMSLDPKWRSTVALVGPAVGLNVALGLLGIGAILSMTTLIVPAIGAILFEIFAATYGSDGRKFNWKG